MDQPVNTTRRITVPVGTSPWCWEPVFEYSRVFEEAKTCATSSSSVHCSEGSTLDT
ncbi:unnamed protein product [Penicillium nalgiovense]|nr:unnamed protein product [Penicillium nalgiovense]